MTTTTATSGSTALDSYLANQKSSTATSTSDATSDRFLKLLVTQMQNQDPLNPMDNAQVTSQMAQINTVTGIDKLNTTVKDLGSNFGQMQLLQAANIVGHSVLIEGNQLNIDSKTGKAFGAFDLDANARSVSIEVLSPSGTVIDTVDRGTLSAGRQDFTWTPPDGVSADQSYTFRIKATTGSTKIGSTALMFDQVDAVSSTSTGSVNLELRNSGTLAYSKVKAVC